MTWGESTFLGETYLNWATLLGGVAVLVAGVAAVWRMLRSREAPGVVPVTPHTAASAGRQKSDGLAKAIVFAPLGYVAASTAAEILKEKLRKQSLDVIASSAPTVFDPAMNGIVADVAGLAIDDDGTTTTDILTQLLS